MQSYTFTNNTFDGDAQQIESASTSRTEPVGPVRSSGRVISGNKFTEPRRRHGLRGPDLAELGWLLYPVGTATITGNTFSEHRRVGT